MVHKSRIQTPIRKTPMFKSIKEFKKIQQIGDGAFSKVYEMEHIQTGKRYAVKDIALAGIEEPDIPNLESELLVHPNMNHPSIVTMYDFLFTDDTLYIFLE